MATMLAMLAAFLVAPQIYGHSADPVYQYLLRSYCDASLAELSVYVWSFLATATPYYLHRAIFVLALTVIAKPL